MRYALCAALLVAATGVEAGGKPGPCVRFARSWDDALTEARALNLPLVIHRHGFY
jgi:hypothetical protein